MAPPNSARSRRPRGRPRRMPSSPRRPGRQQHRCGSRTIEIIGLSLASRGPRGRSSAARSAGSRGPRAGRGRLAPAAGVAGRTYQGGRDGRYPPRRRWLTNLARGYIQSPGRAGGRELPDRDQASCPPATPPGRGDPVTTRNADYATFLKAAEESARAANDPKVLAVRVKRPGHSPEFSRRQGRAPRRAIVHDFLIEVPAPASGGPRAAWPGRPAKIYRITAPDAEFDIEFARRSDHGHVRPAAAGRQDRRVRPRPQAPRSTPSTPRRPRSAPLPAFTNSIVLGVFAQQVGGPADRRAPGQPQRLPGFALTGVSPLDPSGWIRVQPERRMAQPVAASPAQVTRPDPAVPDCRASRGPGRGRRFNP